jgi:hypothetical protein
MKPRIAALTLRREYRYSVRAWGRAMTTQARPRPTLRTTERVQRGAYTIRWNHPVPGALTVHYRGRSLRHLTPKARHFVQELLAQRGMTTLGRSLSAYVWYTAEDEATTSGLQTGEPQPVTMHRQTP